MYVQSNLVKPTPFVQQSFGNKLREVLNRKYGHRYKRPLEIE